ncbi:MAG: NUDIX domain-containing protein [Nanoarchaeota archaeon]|nr:NUDIX domain-containing protein [Nanoarchaeota archaeon]
MKPEKAHYVVATAIVIKDGKYLLLKRAPRETAYPGKWSVPGGKLERKDYEQKPKDSEDAWYHIGEKLVQREVMEEAGIAIKDVKYATSLTFIRPDNIPVVVLSYFADYDHGEVTLQDQSHTDYAWVTVEEAKDYDLIPGIYEELEMVDRHLKGNPLTLWKKKE